MVILLGCGPDFPPHCLHAIPGLGEPDEAYGLHEGNVINIYGAMIDHFARSEVAFLPPCFRLWRHDVSCLRRTVHGYRTPVRLAVRSSRVTLIFSVANGSGQDGRGSPTWQSGTFAVNAYPAGSLA